MQEENTRKVNINWFPGHMTKAKRENAGEAEAGRYGH